MKRLFFACAFLAACKPQPPAPKKPVASPTPPAVVLLYEAVDGNAAEAYGTLTCTVKLPPEFIEYATGGERTREVVETLGKVQDYLDAIRRAAKSRTCEWTYHLKEPGEKPAHLAHGIRAARCLAAAIRERAGRDVDGAIDDSLLGLKLSCDFHNDPNLIGHLVGNVQQSIIAGALRETLLVRPLTRAQVLRLQAHLDYLRRHVRPCSIAIGRDLEEALLGVDSVVDHGFGATLEKVAGSPSTAGAGAGGLIDEIVSRDKEHARKVLRRDLTRRWTALIEWAGTPMHKATCPFNPDDLKDRTTRALTRELLDLPGEPEAAFQAVADCVFILFMPPVEKIQRNAECRRMDLDCLYAWTLLELHRLDHGGYPPSLDAVGFAPVDAFSGKTMLYTKNAARGYVLGSIGPANDFTERVRRLEAAQFGPDGYPEYELMFTIWGRP